MVLTESQAKLNPGDKAPDFSLQSIDDKTYSLADFSRKEGLLVIFMCNHCPYVKTKVEDLNRLHEKFGDRVAVVGINSNDPDFPGEGMENMKQFAAERGIQFAYLLDDSQEVAKAYGAVCTPDPFLFDKDMKLLFHGRINDALQPDDTATEQTMEINLQKMLNGEELDKDFKPSMGCSIKWKA